jgi:hypothetical protein
LLTKVTPEGNAPDSVKVMGVVPVADTVKVPRVPTPKFVAVALEKTGALANAGDAMRTPRDAEASAVASATTPL